MFFTASNLLFDYPGGDGGHDIFPVESKNYLPFGVSSRHNNPYNVTETERVTEMKFSINRMANKLLTNMRNIGGTERLTEFMSRGTWCSLLAELGSKDASLIPREGTNAVIKDTKQVLVKGNLSLESKRLPTRQVSITARTPTQLANLRSYFSSTFGIGIRKRPPSLRAADNGDGISNLQRGDIIHWVDVDLSNDVDQSNADGWLSERLATDGTAYQPQRNFIRLKFDTRTRQFTLAFRALALNAGNCGAEVVREFMTANAIDWYNDDNIEHTHPELTPHRGVMYRGGVWIIDGVNMSQGTFQMHARLDANDIAVEQINNNAAYRLI